MNALARERRHQRVIARPDGRLVDEAALAAWLADIDRRAPGRARVERLSASDPEIAAFEATARGARAVA